MRCASATCTVVDADAEALGDAAPAGDGVAAEAVRDIDSVEAVKEYECLILSCVGVVP